MTDLAILGQDPGFAGGVRAQAEALWHAAIAAGRDPELHYLRYRSLDSTRADTVLRGRSVSPTVPAFDIANVLASSIRIALRTRDARTRFVCAAAASQGYAAVLARKPYGCWVSTSLADEWRTRRNHLDTARRLAHTASASALLLLERETIRNATVRWTISASSQRALAGATGLAESEIRVVPIPVDTERFAPVPDDEWERGLDAPELVFVGRADDPRKNVGLLLDGFTRLRSQLPGASLTLVGTPPAGPLPAGVAAAGTVPSVADSLRRASLFVLPSLQEGFGIVVAEALAAGVPVLVTPCGGPEELVRDSHGGEVLTGFDPDELATRAFALLTDGTLLGEMRRRGREYVVREHDPARLVAALTEAFEVIDDAG